MLSSDKLAEDKMKIKYIIGKPPITTVSKWSEILKYQNTEWSFSRESYSTYRTLEIMDIFWNEIKRSRENLGIPLQGYSWNEFVKYLDNKNIYSELLRIRKILYLDDSINLQLKNLIIGNFVEPTKKPVLDEKFYFWSLKPGKEYSFEPSKEQRGVACISIFYNASKNELRTYLDKKWPVIKKELKKLKNRTVYKIKNRDLEIVESKDTKGKVAKQIETKRIKGKGNINIETSSVHKIYERSMKKINRLVRLKTDVNKIK